MANRVIFVCAVVLAAVYLYATAQIPALEIGDPLGPKAFPRLLGIGLLIAAGLLMLEDRRASKARAATHEVPGKTDWGHLWVIAGVVIWTSVYYAFFETLGYALDTALFLLALMAYFNRGKWVANALTAVLFAAGSYFLFAKVLGVSLPPGILNV